jgi:hypothetical protein
LRRPGQKEQHDLRERRDAVEVDAVEHVVALAPRPDEPGAGQQAQVLGEACLADPDQRRELLRRTLAGRDQLQGPQSGRIGERAQDVDDVLGRKLRLPAGR